MRLLLVFALCAGVAYARQQPAASPPAATENAAEQQPATAAPAEKQTIVVPARTIIPVRLTQNLWSKTARAGDSVRAVTIFPVTVGWVVAIPAGTYVEGAVDKVWKRASSRHPAIELHFTALVFANGYTVSLETATTDVQERLPDEAPESVAGGAQHEAYAFPPASLGATANGFPAQFPLPPPQQPPTLTPPSHPNMGVIIGASLGVTAALVLATIYLSGRPTGGGYTMLDAGSQIDLALESPLTLDAQEVAAAVASPNAQ